jgi:type I restriction enzyme S subunit
MEEIKRVQLSEVAELITKGTTPTTIGFEFQEQGVNFLKIECFDENGGFIESKVTHISEECNKKLRRSQLKEGDLLFSIAGAIGRVAIVTKEMLPANTNQALAIIRIVNEQIYLPYIKLILTSPIVIEQFERKKQGVAQLNLSLKDIREISIPLPSKEKQTELAELFKKVVNIIYKRKEELLALDNLVRSRFVELFGDPELNPMGWEKVTLNDVCSSIVRGPFGSALKKEFFVEPSETTYKVYEQKHAIQKSASIGTYYITQEKYRELKRFECLPGDILMSCSGTMGELYQLPEGCEKGVINQALCKFTLNDKILPVCFLVYMQQTIGKLETKGSGIQNIAAVSYIKQMPINLPPMEVQKKFERFVKQINKSKLIVQKELDETQLLFDSLMQEYFG